MPKQQLNARISDLTRRQLDELTERWGTNQTETLTVLIDRAYQQEQQTMNTTKTYTYFVIEDNAGGLHLFVWGAHDDENEPGYAFHGFEFSPGSLVATLDSLDNGDDPALFDGASETPVDDWAQGYGGQHGYETVCTNLDGKRELFPDKMGRAAQIEFGIDLDRKRYQHISDLAGDGCTPDIVEDFVLNEWDNQAEHVEWIASATDEEIADWIKACRK